MQIMKTMKKLIPKRKPLLKKNGFNSLNRTIEIPIRSYAVVKVYLKEKRHQILLHMETLTFGS